MCILIALRIWLILGGRIFIQIRPFHVVVRVRDLLIHGTDKTGKWTIEMRPWVQYSTWRKKGFHPLMRVI